MFRFEPLVFKRRPHILVSNPWTKQFIKYHTAKIKDSTQVFLVRNESSKKNHSIPQMEYILHIRAFKLIVCTNHKTRLFVRKTTGNEFIIFLLYSQERKTDIFTPKSTKGIHLFLNRQFLMVVRRKPRAICSEYGVVNTAKRSRQFVLYTKIQK